MARYNDKAAADTGAPRPTWTGQRHADYVCAAGGCPLAGALSDTTRGEGTWFCRVHFGRPPSEWGALTEEAFELLRNPPPRVDSPAVAAMKERMVHR